MDEALVRQFVATTSQMYDSLTLYETDRSLGRQKSNASLMQCATTGCSLLSNTAYLQALVDDERTLNQRAAEYSENMRVITGVDHFEFFLEAEARLLEAAGADASLTAVILRRCREARAAAMQGEFNAFRFRDALEELRYAVCSALAELRYATFDPRPLSRRHRRLVACFKGVCGCVVVGLDASALAGTIGLSAAGSAVSIAIGAAVVDHALGDLRIANLANKLDELNERDERENPPPTPA
jgi:hypothetical protein